jgi:hypothetical protein
MRLESLSRYDIWVVDIVTTSDQIWSRFGWSISVANYSEQMINTFFSRLLPTSRGMQDSESHNATHTKLQGATLIKTMSTQSFKSQLGVGRRA